MRAFFGTLSHQALLELPHLVMGLLLLSAALIGLYETLASQPESDAPRVALAFTLVVGGVVVAAVAALEIWSWHDGEYTSRSRLRAFVGALLVIAGLLHGWGRRRGHRPTELAPPFAMMFAGLISALRENAGDSERLLHTAVAGLVLLSTLATISVVLSGERAKSLRLFALLLLAAAALGLMLFEPSSGVATEATPAVTD